MPHGPTPLGRQLCHVLRTFHRPLITNGCLREPTSSLFKEPNGIHHGRKQYSGAAVAEPVPHYDIQEKETKIALARLRWGQSPIAPVTNRGSPRRTTDGDKHADSAGYTPVERSIAETSFHVRMPMSSKRRLRRRSWRHPITDALRLAGNTAVLPKPVSRATRDLSHQQASKRLEAYARNIRKHANDSVASPDRREDVKLMTIVARYIYHDCTETQELRAEWESSFALKPEEGKLLHEHSLAIDDVKLAASILREEDPVMAARMLAEVPESVAGSLMSKAILRYLLRRRYLGAAALRLLLGHAWRSSGLGGENASSLSSEAMITFVRMLRHAREVWPEAMDSITALLLSSLPQPDDRPRTLATRRQMASLTYVTNKVLGLISMPGAVLPFKHNQEQEQALLRVLGYMAGFSPPLALNRQGYRAVIRLQLAQPKTSAEMQWAELKALSWPPWKEDRTGMDASIGLDYGTTRAGHTLLRMSEAGYGPRAWERVAKIYTGWDPDGTPTIQTRTLLVRRNPADAESAIWAARIATTRTVQEAWACYLAYEDSRLPQSEEVHLAILHKLHEEERRHWRTEPAIEPRPAPDGRNAIYPGDGREISPLPPSTHLETYTRTAPPTMDGFYHSQWERGVVFGDRCLAFLVGHASLLKEAVEYLGAATSRYPSLESVLRPSMRDQDRHRLSDIPDRLFASFITALCKHSKIRLPPRVAQASRLHQPSDDRPEPLVPYLRSNDRHPVVYAVHLLSLRPTFYPPPFHTILGALAKYHPHLTKGAPIAFTGIKPPDTAGPEALTAGDHDTHQLVAFRLAYQVLYSARRLHAQIDAQMLHNLCIVTENTMIACWRLLLRDADHAAKRQEASKTNNHQTQVADMGILLAGKTLRRGRRVSALFWEVVGTETRAPADSAPGAAASGPSETSYATSIEIQNDHDFPADTPASSPPAQSDLETPPTPILLTTPSPALLHALIRSLGWSAQYSQLLSLVHWMAFHEPELRAHRTMKEPRNGAILMRRAVVALRVFLERSWLRGIEVGVRSLDGEFRVLSGVAARAYTVMDPPAVVNDVDPHFHPRRPRKPQDPTHLERVLRPADEGLVAKVRGLVDGVEEWGGWPGDEEVEGYCRDEKFEGVRAGVEEMMRER